MSEAEARRAPAPEGSPRRRALAIAIVLCTPLLWLGPCLLGPRTFVPFSLAQFPPVAATLTADQLEAVRRDQNTDVSEIQFTFLPELRFTKQELAAGRLPEWNPYIRGGAPLLATSVVGLLYPPNWVLLAFENPADGLALQCYLSLAIAGLLMLGLCRALGLGWSAAVFGALAFSLSGTFSANAHFYQRLAALVWLPGLLWAAHAVAARRGGAATAPALGLAACVAMTWLAGFPSFAAGVCLVFALYAADRCLRRWRRDGPGAAIRLGGIYGGALGLGFALAAVQLLPMFAFFPESNRTPNPTLAQIETQTYDPAALLGYLMPAAFGHPSSTAELDYDRSPLVLWTFDRADWQTNTPRLPTFNYTEHTVFAGSLVLCLALVGLGAAGHRVRWVALGGWLLLTALAAGSAAYAAVYLLPGLRSVPPLRLMGPVSGLVALLAALGFDAVRRGAGRRWSDLCALLAAAVAAGAALLWWWLSRHTPAEAFDRIVPDLLDHYQRMNAAIDRAGIDAYVSSSRPDQLPRVLAAAHDRLSTNAMHAALAFAGAAAWLLAAPRASSPWRRPVLAAGLLATVAELVVIATGVAGGRVLRHDIDGPVHAFLREARDASRDAGGFTVARATAGANAELAVPLPPCTLVPERIRDLNIYTFIDGRSHLPIRALWGNAQLLRDFWVHALPDGGPRGPLLQHPYLDLLGVRYVLATAPLQHAGRRVGPTLRGPGGEFFVYERPTPLPRAFVVPELVAAADEEAAVAWLTRDELAPRASAVFAGDAPPPLPASSDHADRAPAGERTVAFVRDTPTEIELEVTDGAAGWLVLADSHMSGWTATVEGTPAPIHRVNLFMRGVALPAGAVRVVFRYETPQLRAGFALTAAASVVMIVLALWARRRRTAGGPAPHSPGPDLS